MPETTDPIGRPGPLRRAAAGAWHVPAGFILLIRQPGLWPLALLPTLLATILVFLGGVAGAFLAPRVDHALSPDPGRTPLWLELPISLLLWTATIGAGIFCGLAIALLLASPLLEQLSRRVESRLRGAVKESGRGLAFELLESFRGALYFLLAAPGVFLLGLVPLAGPLLALLFGGRAVAFQMTDPALARRGLSFAEKRLWHRRWRLESQGFGMAGMVAMLVPFANLLFGPALTAGGTLLVLDLEEVAEAGAAPQGGPAAQDSLARG
jgi:CysZ protein